MSSSDLQDPLGLLFGFIVWYSVAWSDATFSLVLTESLTCHLSQSARFYCPQSECFGSAKYCYIRVHLAGKTENVTVR